MTAKETRQKNWPLRVAAARIRRGPSRFNRDTAFRVRFALTEGEALARTAFVVSAKGTRRRR
ncbi:MAG TPA: hypothetical protein DHV38_09650 [Corynebacterium casei]|nr:hypothetical protein [Corynebacterium casei]